MLKDGNFCLWRYTPFSQAQQRRYLGVRIIDLGLTAHPILSGVGFVLSGACGIFSPVVVWQSDKKGLRIIGALVLFAASAIWAWTGYLAYWMHMMVPK